MKNVREFDNGCGRGFFRGKAVLVRRLILAQKYSRTSMARKPLGP